MKRVMGDGYDQSTLHMYESSIMRPTKNCLKVGEGGGVEERVIEGIIQSKYIIYMYRNTTVNPFV
jgi:hypothetical protein